MENENKDTMLELNVLTNFINWIYLMGYPLPNSKCNQDNWDTDDYNKYSEREINEFCDLIDTYIERGD
tara:strand:- start:320 stop:523 length:204 start_codon:yes stop_codon:yes gene_type:complete